MPRRTIAMFEGIHKNRAYSRVQFGGSVPTMPDPVPDNPRPAPSRYMRLTSRSVYDPACSTQTTRGPNWDLAGLR